MDSFYDAHSAHSTGSHTETIEDVTSSDGFDSHHLGSHHTDDGMIPTGDHQVDPAAGTGLGHSAGYEEDNSDLIMSYQDPLIHSANYHMEPFHVMQEAFGAEYTDDGRSVMHGMLAQGGSYTVAPDGGLMPEIRSANDLPGVKNGMLVDASQLDQIISLGEVQGTHHVDSIHENRSEAVKEEFLHLNGYASIPAGYEIHHIVPLSEGGADDVRNMILLRADEHAAVTAAQRQYYGWGEE